ncbi:MAG: hypothetical protein ACT6SG_20470 [Hydrogenophaga sp.]|uniref:hypothetical protein n=1 Tax=Hydrogenophaga sp. TaxID=1904254 RepID=UPI00403515DF
MKHYAVSNILIHMEDDQIRDFYKLNKSSAETSIMGFSAQTINTAVPIATNPGSSGFSSEQMNFIVQQLMAMQGNATALNSINDPGKKLIPSSIQLQPVSTDPVFPPNPLPSSSSAPKAGDSASDNKDPKILTPEELAAESVNNKYVKLIN